MTVKNQTVNELQRIIIIKKILMRKHNVEKIQSVLFNFSYFFFYNIGKQRNYITATILMPRDKHSIKNKTLNKQKHLNHDLIYNF